MRMVKRSLVLGTVFVGLLAASAHAEETIDANVPFSFVVEDFSLNRLRKLSADDVERRYRQFVALTEF